MAGLKPEPAAAAARLRYASVRNASLAIAAPLSAEDCQAQSMPDASPVKWHLAHTSWFFETFLLAPAIADYAPFHPGFSHLYNSYYNGIGEQAPRGERGLVTRPSLAEVQAWRQHVDDAMARLLEQGNVDPDLVALGLFHEEQHQELMLTDLKHLLSRNPLQPAYLPRWPLARVAPVPRSWCAFAGGLVEIGATGDGFAADNEGPRHRVILKPFALASHPVTNADWIAFLEDDGYGRPDHWLSAGWDWRCREGVEAPLYWRRDGSGWRCFTLHGEAPVDPHAPVAHVSFYEADAFARWAGARLPTEAEWEHAAATIPVAGNFADRGHLHPVAPERPGEGPQQMFGDVWEWTASAYLPYPGYRPAAGAIGEYNGKFMSGQMVLKGGSCATPAGHVRASYRNFFPPEARWQFAGLRLARDGDERPRQDATFMSVSTPGDPRAALAEGLLADPPRIASGHLYDPLGCKLFEAITELPEYGLTRAEAALFADHADALAAEARARLGDRFQLVDLGAGNCAKAESLLPTLAPARYVAIDIAQDFLKDSLKRVSDRNPALAVVAVGMDFLDGFRLPEALGDMPSLFFWPGSSIGNLAPADALAFLREVRNSVPAAAILLGADLVRDAAELEAAYDDAAGVTAAFNRNILVAVNRQLGSDFDPRAFAHVARFNARESRVEMWLEALVDQSVTWPGGGRVFAAGSQILTEISAKWTPARLEALLEDAGFAQPRLWAGDHFALVLGG